MTWLSCTKQVLFKEENGKHKYKYKNTKRAQFSRSYILIYSMRAMRVHVRKSELSVQI